MLRERRRADDRTMRIDIDLLTDVTTCPACEGRVGPTGTCGSCGADLNGELGRGIWRLSVRATETLRERAHLVDQLRDEAKAQGAVAYGSEKAGARLVVPGQPTSPP